MSESPRPAKRARSAIACHRCKHRKQRCDNGYPSCSSCLAAGQTCSYASNVYPSEYVESLDRRLASLERLLASQQPQLLHSPSPARSPVTQDNAASSARRHASNVLDVDRAATVQVRSDNVKDLEEHELVDETEAGFDMLSSDSYLGVSSGFSLAKTLRSVIAPASSTFSERASSRRDAVDSAMATIRPVKPCTPSAYTGARFIRAYLAKVHPKHPFLAPRRIWRMHEAQGHLAKVSMAGRLVSRKPRLELFNLFMIYAIGARYLQLSSDDAQYSFEAYYTAALDHLDTAFECRALESLEAMLLLVIYQLRSPSPPGIWSVLGLTMRHAVTLGLHRKFQGGHALDQRRKRIFWTIYMLERSIARTLGRPVCLADRDIDVELPANIDVDIEDDDGVFAAMSERQSPSPMSASIHIFRLAQIESKIYSTVHRVDRSFSEIPPRKFAHLRQLLEQWKADIPAAVPNTGDGSETSNYYVTHNYHLVQYHRAILLLFLPCLTQLRVSHEDFHLCVSSACQVAQLYKWLHDHQRMLSYSLIALHATFVAGLTLIYCFLSDASIFNIHFSSSLRACSTVLGAIAERWPAARKVRDAYERLVSLGVERADQLPSMGASPSASGLGLPHSPPRIDTLWSDLTAQIPAIGIPPLDASMSGPNGIWNSLGTWFEENEDSWLNEAIRAEDQFSLPPSTGYWEAHS